MDNYSRSALVLCDILIIFSHVFKRISFYNHQLICDKKAFYIGTEIFERMINFTYISPPPFIDFLSLY